MLIVKEGEIYAIPLFVSDKPDNTSFIRDSFHDKGKEFAYCRIIEDRLGSGILVEVFNLVNDLNIDIETIIKSDRLFPAVAITGDGIYKKRWKKIKNNKVYSKEHDSNYSSIKFILGTDDELFLWQNGSKKSITQVETHKYEKWIIWRASHLEKRIIKEIFDN